MDFRVLGAFVRSASFELENNDACNSKVPYTIELNGKCIAKNQKRNVFSLYGLCPETEYNISVCTEDGLSTVKTFRTLKESFRLNIRDFGAAGDGKTLDTHAIQAAILACPKQGTVLFPKGTYYTSPLFLKSNITIELDPEAVILGATERSLYPVLPGVTLAENEKDEYYLGIFEGNPLSSFASLLTGIGVKNVDIIGCGTFNANANHGDWWIEPKKKHGAWRPRMLFLNHCENVRVQGVTFCNSYAWTVHPCFSKKVDLFDLKIKNDPNSPNTDGIDVESCREVDIIGTQISVGDDCIALKSCKMYLGEKLKTPTCRVKVRNCLLERGHGAVVIGSEVSAGVHDVCAQQCIFSGTDRGLRIKTRRGRGKLSVVDGIQFSNIIMEQVITPFVINMFYFCDPDGHSEFVWSKEKKPIDEFTPKVGSLKCENIVCKNCSVAGMFFYGLPEMPIEKIEMNHIGISFVKDAEPGYPAMMDQIEKVKKLGAYVNNVKQLSLNDVVIEGYEGQKITTVNVENFTQGEQRNGNRHKATEFEFESAN